MRFHLRHLCSSFLSQFSLHHDIPYDVFTSESALSHLDIYAVSPMAFFPGFEFLENCAVTISRGNSTYKKQLLIVPKQSIRKTTESTKLCTMIPKFNRVTAV